MKNDNKINDRIRIDVLAHEYHPSARERFKWLFVVIVSSSFCCYLVVNSCVDYAKFQVTTSYRIHSELKTVFPRIILCSVNPMNSDYFVHLVKNANLTEGKVKFFINYQLSVLYY